MEYFVPTILFIIIMTVVLPDFNSNARGWFLSVGRRFLAFLIEIISQYPLLNPDASTTTGGSTATTDGTVMQPHARNNQLVSTVPANSNELVSTVLADYDVALDNVPGLISTQDARPSDNSFPPNAENEGNATGHGSNYFRPTIVVINNPRYAINNDNSNTNTNTTTTTNTSNHETAVPLDLSSHSTRRRSTHRRTRPSTRPSTRRRRSTGVDHDVPPPPQRDETPPRRPSTRPSTRRSTRSRRSTGVDHDVPPPPQRDETLRTRPSTRPSTRRRRSTGVDHDVPPPPQRDETLRTRPRRVSLAQKKARQDAKKFFDDKKK